MLLIKKIESIYLKILLDLSKFYIKNRRISTISKRIINIEENYTRSLNYKKAFTTLLNKKINYLDVGARKGPDERLLKYKEFFSIFLCEPENQEAKELKKKDYTVIEKIISEKIGKKKLYLTNDLLTNIITQVYRNFVCRGWFLKAHGSLTFAP